MSEMRLELTRHNCHYPLKVARLPIPPSGHLLSKSEKRDSNPRPQPWQGCALPTELFSRMLMFSFSCRVELSEKRDSNPRPQPWQGCALPTELFSHLFCWFCDCKVMHFLRTEQIFCYNFLNFFISHWKSGCKYCPLLRVCLP